MTKRVISDIILFLSIFFLPWWAAVMLVIIFMLLFKHPWEGVVVMFFIDALYSISSTQSYVRFGIFTVSAIIFFIILESLKTRIRFHL